VAVSLLFLGSVHDLQGRSEEVDHDAQEALPSSNPTIMPAKLSSVLRCTEGRRGTAEIPVRWIRSDMPSKWPKRWAILARCL